MWVLPTLTRKLRGKWTCSWMEIKCPWALQNFQTQKSTIAEINSHIVSEAILLNYWCLQPNFSYIGACKQSGSMSPCCLSQFWMALSEIRVRTLSDEASFLCSLMQRPNMFVTVSWSLLCPQSLLCIQVFGLLTSSVDLYGHLDLA